MNMLRNKRLPRIFNRMVFRLWLIMMSLVLFSAAFMWVVQIFLFERNYANAALEETRERMRPILESLHSESFSSDDRLLSHLSRAAGGELMLVNNDGELLAFYNNGHSIDLNTLREDGRIWFTVRKSHEYQQMLEGRPYEKWEKAGGRIFAFEIGIPIRYNGQQCYAILHNTLQLHTILELNRRQLILLTVVLTAAASILSALLSRQFTRPIYAIKNAIDRLAKNDFSAKAGLKRRDELGDLSQSVDELGQALKRVDVLRKEVIANVSHELRSPLAIIAGYGEMVRDIDWREDAAREEDLNLIIEEANRMSEMVNDILDYSLLQSGYIPLKKDLYNLCEIAQSEVEHCEKSAAEHGISIHFRACLPELPILADALKMSQVLRNLLYNAINHTPDGRAITLSIDPAPENGFRVSVINPGEPIPEEDRQIIWERYQRSQHENGRRHGTGIGLSIVSTILEAHGMAYGVDCQDGLTIFWFEVLAA